jgi:hypothetical protein
MDEDDWAAFESRVGAAKAPPGQEGMEDDDDDDFAWAPAPAGMAPCPARQALRIARKPWLLNNEFDQAVLGARKLKTE